MTEPAPPRTERVDFRATSDPALQESADRGEANLLTYRELYELWERQQWAVQDLDFTQDRIDWHERIDPEERVARLYGLSSFFVGEQRVAAELGPIMRAVPDEDMRIFLCTQIADEARHVAFFDRFYREVGVLEADGLQERLEETCEHLNPEFHTLFDEMLHSRVDRLAVEPEDREALVEAITIYHMITEGMLALTGQHFIIDFNERAGTLPGFVAGFTNVARDEHRHVAFGARFLRDMAREDPRYGAAIQRALVEAGPVAEGVLRAEVDPRGRRRRRHALRRRLGGGDARLRAAGAAAPAEGHRPGDRRLTPAATLTSVSVVREEFGPTLPELLGARLRVPARTIWRVLAAVGVLVVLVLVWLAFVRGTPGQAGVMGPHPGLPGRAAHEGQPGQHEHDERRRPPPGRATSARRHAQPRPESSGSVGPNSSRTTDTPVRVAAASGGGGEADDLQPALRAPAARRRASRSTEAPTSARRRRHVLGDPLRAQDALGDRPGLDQRALDAAP